jgi:hypothetical protein
MYFEVWEGQHIRAEDIREGFWLRPIHDPSLIIIPYKDWQEEESLPPF